MRALPCWALLVSLAAACGGDDDVVKLDVPPACNPLQGGACLAPWPVSSYLVADATSPTGVVLAVPPGAVPPGNGGAVFDPAHINGRSGYSPATQIIAHFGVELDGGNLAGFDAIGASLTAASPTAIVDATTGALVAHFAEVDANALPNDGARQALYLRPTTRLEGGHRYLVAIKKSLRAADGAAIAVPAGFAAIVSGATTDNARLEALRPSYPDIFAALTAAGIATDDLLLAWDFTTAPDEELRRDLLGARDAAATFQGAGGANLALHDIVVETTPRPGLAKRVFFSFDAPDVRDGDGLTRDSMGRPEVRSTSLARGVALVPECATAAAPAPITVFGHGFFGGIEETGGAYLQAFAVRSCRIIIGTDWRGMSNPDAASALIALGNLDKVIGFGERIVQGMIDVEALVALAPTQLATQVLTDGTGASVADTTAEITFYGISQGHILGSTLYAIDPHMRRAALNVGGANWSLLFERSTNWATLSLPFKGTYPDPLTQTLLQQIVQMGLDVIDPLHWAPLARDASLGKSYLLHTSLGDAQVTNLGAFLQARTMGLDLAAPAVTIPYGLALAGAAPTSGLVIVDEDPTPKPPTTNLLNTMNNQAHENARRRARIMDQIDRFLDDGTIIDACGGVCDCVAGACGPLVTE
ncbi:MAG: hypothetical protein IPL61_30250 [Myxococcales bacterium]|nr:hypothetical protein [Myxococcales bacterium]